MKSINNIISQALEQCQPSAEDAEKLTKVAIETKNLVRGYTSPNIVDIVFGGSFAKGTWLKDEVDIDIFIKIDTSVKDKEFGQLGVQVGLQSLKEYHPYLRYSDHPYVEAVINGIRVNVVPCYDVLKGKWKSAADRSPFHTEYIKNNLDDKKKNQVRLLKTFLKSVGIYGADIATEGFSGYVAEIMILKYGTFESLLRAMADIGAQNNLISIDKPDEQSVKNFESQLIIIDPIDHRRNLGTAISAESVGKLVLAARSFLAKPSFDFFIKLEKKFSGICEGLYPNLVIIEFSYKRRSPDVIWGQLKRSLNAISKQLELADFRVIKSICATDQQETAIFVFLLESVTLSTYTQKVGPKIFMRKETANFILKNQKKSLIAWADSEMRVSTVIQRESTNAKHFLRLLLAKKIESTGITKGLKGDIQRLFRIYSGDEQEINGLAKEAVRDLITSDQRIL
ncbi:MAG TPA: CCA tRNA nucleotidyltransferase [Candidatus Nitrosopolaris sp.]|nr:CCA tRNA nucleotidyltransferase [Candidatus Nitrosopolaris sp.]